MDKSYNQKIRPLLDLADKLTYLLKDTSLKIPRIASCGMQSHGKSSTIESITNISLPQGEGTVTVCPIKISLRNTNGEEYARIKYDLEPDERYEKIKLEDISNKINEYQDKVKEENNVRENEIRLFDKAIQVEVNRKNAPNLTLYDLPGLNFNEQIRKKSEEINEKFLKEEQTTVLLVISGSEEVNNAYATEWMKKIPNYKKRFNAIISKADFLIDRNLELYLKQIESLKLENNPSLIINKCKKFEDLSYDEMRQKELELINKIPNINKYPQINKGIEKLIEQLIEIQKKDLDETFKDIVSKIKKEIKKNQDVLNHYPSPCKSQGEFFNILEELITDFKEGIKNKMESLNYKEEEGKPKKEDNLLKYGIQLFFREHIKNVKIKINDLFDLPFCEKLTNNIIQINSDNIPILEDYLAFNTLLKPKIKEILSGFDETIEKIYEYMFNNIKPIICKSFKEKEYASLTKKILKLYKDYSIEQKTQTINFYNQIVFLETENVSTFNVEIINKVNTLNKDLNYYIFGNIKGEVYKHFFEYLKELPKKEKLNEKKGEDEKEEDKKEEDKKEEDKKEEDKKEEKKDNDEKPSNETKVETGEEDKNENIPNNISTEIKQISVNMLKKEGNISMKIEHLREKILKTYVFRAIDNLNDEIQYNKVCEEDVKNKYKEYTEYIKSLINSIYNYEKEKKTREYDSQEFLGRIKIAYRPQDVGTFYERLINEEFENFKKEIEGKYEPFFIPGFQYIDKGKLGEFKTNIQSGKIQIKTANIITKMVSYLEIMLNRVLDMVFLSIQKYLYDGLIDDKMICHIRNKIHLLNFKRCQELIEMKPDFTKKREECTKNIKNLKTALKEIFNLNEEVRFIEDEDDLDDSEENEEQQI